MDKDLQELDEITFGVFSPEEIKNMSVCKITSSKLCNSDKTSLYGTVYDPRLGIIENGKLCETCSLGIWECPGHWGYIELNEPIIHPLFYKQVVNFLSCFCIKCFSLLITEDKILLNGLNKFKSTRRFDKILEKLEKIDICHNCSQLQPAIKYITTDNSISLVYKQKDKGKVSIILPVDEIKKTFDNINDKDVELLGFNTKLIHPRNLILTVFPVIPLCCRPYIITDNNICDDDLTVQLVEIIKANNNLEVTDTKSIQESKRQKALQSLKFRISTFYNNSSG
jgi:DNA-directed RNA polymerase beta' subunit